MCVCAHACVRMCLIMLCLCDITVDCLLMYVQLSGFVNANERGWGEFRCSLTALAEGPQKLSKQPESQKASALLSPLPRSGEPIMPLHMRQPNSALGRARIRNPDPWCVTAANCVSTTVSHCSTWSVANGFSNGILPLHP